MFWKRKKKMGQILGGMPYKIPPIPPRKEYESMLDFLRQAEFYNKSNSYKEEAMILEDIKVLIDSQIIELTKLK